MERNDYLKMLVEEMHSTTMATIGADGHPQTRVIDMMLWDKKGVYFLTAKGKAFYAQLMEQGYVAISATKDKKAVSLRGRIQNIHSEKLDEIFGKIHTCRKFIPAIHARHLRCSACTRPRRILRHQPHPGRHRPAPVPALRPMRGDVSERNDSQKRAVVPLF